MVNGGTVLCDVGTDHGFLPISLVLDGEIDRAIAMDLRSGPLARAKEHVKEYHLEDRIETRLSDGLMEVKVGECDLVSITGMGGRTMHDIIEERKDVATSVNHLILQPQSEIPEFRKYLYENGFVIVEEDCIFEDGKYYFLMKTARGTGKITDFEAEFGPRLLEDENETLKDFILKEIRTNEHVRENLSKAKANEKNRESLKKNEIKAELLKEAKERLKI
jgi:tRNA (adenine22-N1)-methyltransferase